MSSAYNGKDMKNLYDNNPSTIAHTQVAIDTNDTVVINLHPPRHVSSVVVMNRNIQAYLARLDNATITLKDSHEAEVICGYIRTNGTPSQIITVVCGANRGTTSRIIIKPRNGSSSLNIAELRVCLMLPDHGKYPVFISLLGLRS